MIATASPSDRLRQQKAVLIIVLASYMMILLDTSILITGLPEIQVEFGFSAAMLAWVQTAYMIAFGGFLMLGARMGDLMGRKRMFLAGLTLFTLASLAIGAAPSSAVILLARAVQGLGAAILAPSTLALLQVHFAEGEERTRALSAYAATAGIGSSLGLVLGGVFAGWLSWRVGFFVNVPVGIAIYFVASRLRPKPPHLPAGSICSEPSPPPSAWPPWSMASPARPAPAGLSR